MLWWGLVDGFVSWFWLFSVGCCFTLCCKAVLLSESRMGLWVWAHILVSIVIYKMRRIGPGV